MNRQFQSKISFGNYVLLAALLSVAIYFIWQTETVLARSLSGIMLAIDLFVMVIVIERMIHTTYTVTADKQLIIHKGRFGKDIIISLDEIDKIDRINRLRIAGKPLQTSLVIVTRDQTEYYITPTNEEDFIKCIIQRKKKEQED